MTRLTLSQNLARILELVVATALATAIATIVLTLLCWSPAGAETVNPATLGCTVRSATGVAVIVIGSMSLGSIIGLLTAGLLRMGADHG